MREIVLDTETTGLDPNDGHRLVEIGCVELINRFPTGNVFHVYINPQRDMPDGAFQVHGLSAEFLSGHPVFSSVADGFLEFIADDDLVIHNAAFDVKFLNAELSWIDRPLLQMSRVVDTLALARRKHPGARNSLDALCDRYGIDSSARVKHGALLDSEILADVYVALLGITQAKLEFASAGRGDSGGSGQAVSTVRRRPQPLPPRLSEEERAAHSAFVRSLGADAMWANWLVETTGS